jgi:predicted MPP superfamily phosphohydrolase
MCMQFGKISRRRFLLAASLLLAPAALVADAKWIEPTWLKIRRLRLTRSRPSHRLVHFTDLHHKGDRAYAQAHIDAINSLFGLYQTPAGPLYVNPGIGWFNFPWRFNCRPEITLIEI